MKFQSVSKRFDPIPVRLSRRSQTVPDMSYTPREIIAKFSRGEKVPLGFMGKYDSEDDPDSLGKYDPAIFEDDPTRDLGFDFGDYVEEKHALSERQRESSRRASKQTNEVKDVNYEQTQPSESTKDASSTD